LLYVGVRALLVVVWQGILLHLHLYSLLFELVTIGISEAELTVNILCSLLASDGHSDLESIMMYKTFILDLGYNQ
jgi:hypothetical protein